MMIRAAGAAALLLLSACNTETSSEKPAANSVAEQPKPAAEVPSLAGDWRVTRIEGRDAAGLGMTASFQGELATLAAGCLRRAWTYTQKRNMVSFKSSPSGSSNCGSAPSGEAETAYAALEGATIAIFAKDGKEASLSGAGGNLTIERR